MKDDGRHLIYYSFECPGEPGGGGPAAPAERGDPSAFRGMGGSGRPATCGRRPGAEEGRGLRVSELRWNPVLGEWIVTATHRQDRTYHPPADFCPLCPTRPGAHPTEVPAEDYEIVVFENKFPSFCRTPPEPSVEGDDLYQVRPSRGICEVVLYSPSHNGSLATSNVVDIARLVDVWTDRYEDLGSLDYVDYVLIFENKGEVIGVTLEHPHGQIYALWTRGHGFRECVHHEFVELLLFLRCGPRLTVRESERGEKKDAQKNAKRGEQFAGYPQGGKRAGSPTSLQVPSPPSVVAALLHGAADPRASSLRRGPNPLPGQVEL